MENPIKQKNSVINPPRKVEIIDDIVYMSPAPTFKHNKVMFRITVGFENYLRGKKCSVHQTGNVYFNPDKPKEHVIPDISVMCEPDKFKPAGYYGVPSLIVEILSSNRKDDLGTKFKLYERIGVSEYWIVDPVSDTISQYILIDGRYELLEAYCHLSEEDFSYLDEDEQKEHKTVIVPNLFKDLEILVADIFEE